MTGALLYLQVTSLRNSVVGRVKRLRNPRYLVAALVGAAYFYFVLFRGNGGHHPAPPSTAGLPGLPVEVFELLGALALFVAVVLAWILPSGRAALTFTEAEVAFLFPAPVSRRALVHYKLLKSQVSVFFSALVLTLISNRWSFAGGGAWLHAAGWWSIFSFYSLHLIGASFARERLLGYGVDNTRRRLAAVAVLILIVSASWLWLDKSLPAPTDNDTQNIASTLEYGRTLLTTPPLGWVLMPFRWVVRPFLAVDLAGFLSTIWPVLLLLAAQYFWVIRSQVAFEEASLARSEKHAEQAAALRAGRWPSRSPARKRREPFALSAHGAPSPAFLWKGLIAAGPLYYPRYWLMVGWLLCAGLIWLGDGPYYRVVMGWTVAISSALAVYGVLFGPVLARRGVGLMLERMDLVKSYPLRGWQVLLGELLSPVVMLCVFEWIMLALLALAVLFLQRGEEVSTWVLMTGMVSAWVLVVPLAGLLFAMNFAGALYFPAWLSSSSQTGAGIEKVGQRLIFFVGYMLVIVFLLLPALLLAALPAWALVALGLPTVAIGTGAAIAGTVLFGELAIVLWALGGRFERFDLSEELPR